MTFYKHPLFILGVAIRVALLFVPGSHYLNELFIPFVDAGIKNLGTNPWSLNPSNFFPYGSVLYAIFFIPKYLGYLIVGDAAIGLNPLSFFLFKLPLLAFDFLFLKTLIGLNEKRVNTAIWFYWLNPVLVYISYIHGQLDLIPTFFVFNSVLLLSRDKMMPSSIFAGLALAAKFHTALVFPLCLAFMWNRDFSKPALKKIGAWIGPALLIVVLSFLPHMMSNLIGYSTVGSPEALRIFGIQFAFSDNRLVYFGFAIVIAVLARLCFSTRMTPEGLVLGAGVLFGTLLISVDTMPGWYFWFLPFVTYFYLFYSYSFKSLFWSAVAFYFLGFIQIQGPVLGQAAGFVNNVGFTLLQLSIFALILNMWRQGIRVEMPFIRRLKPLLIGISGDSGSGKNTLSEAFRKVFGQNLSVCLEGDDYHKWERGNAKWTDYTHLDPKANELDDLSKHTSDLVTGKYVYQPHYDHASGKFTTPQEIPASRTVIVQGLHTLYKREMRELFDLKIFLDPSPSVRLKWKMSRDVEQRGHTPEKVVETFKKRLDDSEKFIQPQRDVSDWVIAFEPVESSKAPIAEKVDIHTPMPVRLIQSLWNDVYVEDILSALKAVEPTLLVAMERTEDMLNRVRVSTQGNVTAAQIDKVAHQLFPDLRHLTRSQTAPSFEGGFYGVLQLFLLAQLRSAQAKALQGELS